VHGANAVRARADIRDTNARANERCRLGARDDDATD